MRVLLPVALCVTVSLMAPHLLVAADPNALTAEEAATGFEVLFDGETLAGWEHGGNWKVENGVLTRSGKGGSLTYTTQTVPDDFELRFQWKVAQGSNSGVYYRPGQYEYQILDNAVHADGKNPRTSAASLYFCMAPSRDATRPVGEWNEGRVVCKGSVIQHWLNGEKVLDFDYDDPQWAWNVALLKNRGAELVDRGAQLSLQDHGDPVWYRGIKLRELSADDAIDQSPVAPAEIPHEAMAEEQIKLQRIMAGRARQQQNQRRSR